MILRGPIGDCGKGFSWVYPIASEARRNKPDLIVIEGRVPFMAILLFRRGQPVGGVVTNQ